MFNIKRVLDAFCREQSGQDMVEFALLAGLVAVASGLFAPDLSASLETVYERLASKLNEAAS